MFLAFLILRGVDFFKMERTFFFLVFCLPSIQAVWRGFNSDFGKAENLFFWGERIFPLCLRLFLFLARAEEGSGEESVRALGGLGFPHEYIHDWLGLFHLTVKMCYNKGKIMNKILARIERERE